jgi:hypothetical protein
MEEVVLPLAFQDHGVEVPYTPRQLEPTVRRLRDALVKDLANGSGPNHQRLAAAWTRIAELRLPRKAVPNAVLDEIEELCLHWDLFPDRGISQYAASLSEEQVRSEIDRIAQMLRDVEEAVALGYTVEVVPTE